MWVKYAFLALLLVWAGYEFNSYKERNYQGFQLVAYTIFMILFWVWLYGFTYTVQVEKSEIRIIRKLWSWERVLIVRRGQIMGIYELYQRKYGRELKIRKYMHQYSWADSRPTRAIVFRDDNNSKPQAILLRGSQSLIEVLERYYPHEVIGSQN